MEEQQKQEEQVVRYEDAAIDARILRAVKEMGFEQMTPIQAQAIPVLLEGRDIIGQAQTGTGKTAAFGIPLIQKVDPDVRGVQGIVLCPTRELAIQAAEEMRRFAKFMQGVKVLPIYGGQDITKQIRSLKSDVQIVVGTPGRVMDHMRRHTLKLQDIHTVVLDEADEMLNMGFREDIESILLEMPENHQTALFSATMPKPILDITKQYQQNAVMVKMTKKEITIPLVKQYYYEVKKQNKEEVVCRLLDYYNPKRSLIFCNTKRMVDELAESLKGRGYFAEGLHGDLSQNQRDKVMNLFRNGKVDILIATDVAARGIDVDDVEAVFNYDVPQDIEYYVHRIGRTGRAGKKGRSFTLVVGREIYKVREIERSCKTEIKPRSIPSVEDVTNQKSDKIMKEVMSVIAENDLASMNRIIEQKMEDEDCTAMEIAAAFLRMHMGEEIQEIVIEKEPYRGRNRSYDAKRRDGKSSYGKPAYGKSAYGKSHGDDKTRKKRYKDSDYQVTDKKSYDDKRSSWDKKASDSKKAWDGKKSEGKKSWDGKKSEGRKPWDGKKSEDKKARDGKKSEGKKSKKKEY